MDQSSKIIEQLICESNKNFYNNQIQSAIANAEKAYSICKNSDTCPIITRHKIEFNLACLYCSSSNLEECLKSKAYLDLIKNSTILFMRKQQIGILYSKLANEFTFDNIDLKIDCFKSAADCFAKAKDWIQFCNIEIDHAQLLNDIRCFKESLDVANKIQTACIYLIDTQTLAKILCDLSTIFASDVRNETKIKNAKRLLKLALDLIKSHEFNIIYDLKLCIYQNLASVNNQLGNYNKAIKFVIKSYQLIEQSNLGNKKYFILSDLKFIQGYAYAKLQSFDNAIQAYLDSHNYAKKTNQKNIWESLEDLGQLFKFQKEYQQSYYYFDKSLKYFNINKKKNSILGKTELVENRLKAKKKIVSNILKQTNQDVTSATELFDEEAIKNASQTSLNDSNASKKDENSKEINIENHISTLIEENLSLHLNQNETKIDLFSNEVLDKNVTHNETNTTAETNISDLSDTQRIESLLEDLVKKDEQISLANQTVSDSVNHTTITDIYDETSTINKESTHNSSNIFSIYTENSPKTTYKGGTKSYDSFNQGCIKDHPELPFSNHLKQLENKENSKVCILS